ncbi:hypothetical protein [Paenibacillus harenae]|uniref:DUF4367 domain-containing protein n=1 Tax=Paenibacillus harenae TaxID=306543 RepID=A0ABT9U082_PAEHA|nr:hypothetical protein [Paenibacillus harenae]MDQ0112662.1 hypothetical protein [Paenibacillus harenae]
MDQKLKQRLLEQSDASIGLKDEIWERLESQLDATSLQAASYKAKRKSSKWMKTTTGIAAAAIALVAFLALPPGTALMKSVQSWFAPEKKIEISVEGQKEQTNGQVHVDEESRYAIYYDKDRYKLIPGEGKDTITTIEELPAPYPQVSLTIEQDVKQTPEQLANQVAAQLAERFSKVDAVERVSSPVDGYRIHAINGNDRLSEVATVYVTSNKLKGSFVLSLEYFLEAAEGHGARFEQTVKQFEVLGPSEQ